MADDTDHEREENDEPSARSSRNPWTKVGVAMGIGSAALVAALLYAGRRKPDDKPRPREDYTD